MTKKDLNKARAYALKNKQENIHEDRIVQDINRHYVAGKYNCSSINYDNNDIMGYNTHNNKSTKLVYTKSNGGKQDIMLKGYGEYDIPIATISNLKFNYTNVGIDSSYSNIKFDCFSVYEK